MRAPMLFAVAGLVVAGLAASTQLVTRPQRVPDVKLPDGGTVLPNGWKITPAGRAIPLPGDMPLRAVFSPDAKYLLVSTGGFHDHGIDVIDVQSEKLVQTYDMGVCWAGIAFSPQGDKVYVSGGNTPVQILSFDDGRLSESGRLDIEGLKPAQRHIAAIAVAKDGAVYAVNMTNDTVYKIAGAQTTGVQVGYRPYAAALSGDGKTLAVTNWGDGSVMLLDTDPLKVRTVVKVGSHPNDIVFGKQGKLYVSNGGENTVSVIRDERAVETIRTSIDPKAPMGSTPDSLAISLDGKALFVANADNNDITLVDLSDPFASRVAGFIPTGWYPSVVAVSPDATKIFVGTAKGLGFSPNNLATTRQPSTNHDGTKRDYIGSLLHGTLSVISMPTAKELDGYTRQVRDNLAATSAENLPAPEAKDIEKNALGKIKHVVFVIRENRTYDQVFGDIPKGNGDRKLTMFGEQITPNAHQMARDWVLLDNLYCNGEVSQDGHQWCNAAYATDYVEKAWILNYSGRKQPDADDRLESSPAGYLWDNCRKHKVTYRSYGEFASFKSDPDTQPRFEGDKGLEGAASVAWFEASKKTPRDYQRIDAFIQELRDAEKSGKWPSYMVMSLGENHTNGARAGAFTPQAAVASNDLALGKMVEAISHSKFWKDTAIFVMEDDAQDGPDHVDAHRTDGLVISPYVRRGVVDSTLYSTASMIRTMELILDLPPMTQFDQKAAPMLRCFTTKADFRPYNALPANVDLQARNPKKGALALASEKLDWSGYDRANPTELNRILWSMLRPGEPMPAPVHGAPISVARPSRP